MKTKLDESLINKKTYEHMLDRMKKDKISHKINSTNMENQLNTEIHSFENKTLQKQKLKQFHLQSQYVLDELMKVKNCLLLFFLCNFCFVLTYFY